VSDVKIEVDPLEKELLATVEYEWAAIFKQLEKVAHPL